MATAEQATSQTAAPVVKRQGPRMLEVLRVTDITPHMRRITLGGAEIEGFPSGRNGSHIKVLLPREGQSKPVLPTLGPNGPVWPPADERPIVRTYTIRAFRADVGELDVDFVLHGDNGPASRWAIAAQPGDLVGIAGPGGRGPIPPEAKWYFFSGDASALPAISAHLELLPTDAQGAAFIEVDDASEQQSLVHPAGVKVVWLYRNGTAPEQSTLLIDAIRACEWPEGKVFFWIAGEASSVAAVRHYARVERGLERGQVEAVPYWKAGVGEEAYHDERHRVMDEDEE